jgi:glycosyltransferase involved in cell wall biosynthesis
MPVPYGVRLVVSPSVEELDTLINQAEIHVCPSRAEGWGHYITEAMSAEAVVVTTNGSPMNEHIRPGWGFLIDAPTGPSKHHQSHLLLAGPDSIAEAVRRAASLAPEDRSEMGRLARRHFLVRNHAFRDTALELLEKL